MANVKTDTFSGGYGNTQHNARNLLHHRIKLRPPNPRLRLGKYPAGFPILDHVFKSVKRISALLILIFSSHYPMLFIFLPCLDGQTFKMTKETPHTCITKFGAYHPQRQPPDISFFWPNHPNCENGDNLLICYAFSPKSIIPSFFGMKSA